MKKLILGLAVAVTMLFSTDALAKDYLKCTNSIVMSSSYENGTWTYTETMMQTCSDGTTCVVDVKTLEVKFY
tara:strand:- start:255 stop:470 length:216 start_codon:yes stop_codon:yes gene_type:complete